MKIFDKLYNILKPKQFMKGKKVKLINGPNTLATSSNSYRGTNTVFTVGDRSPSYDRAWYLKGGENCESSYGWAFEWEMVIDAQTKEDFEKRLKELNDEVEIVKTKIEWLNESGNEEYNEDEYKVYQTLKLLENDKMSRQEKSKLIAELIKK
jgi:hypothetical protein